MAEDDCPGALAAGQGRPQRVYVRWSEALGQRLCERLAAGELIYRIAREPGMPTPEAVLKWAREKPAFAEALAAARRAGGRPLGARGPVSTYCEETAHEIFERLCDGESFTAIGRDPTMPSLSTIFNWRKRIMAFEEAVQLGMRIRGERFCDLGWEMAEAATPETAYLTHVRLTHLRWTAGIMAPRVFRTKAAEPEKAPEVQTILFRHFEVEVDAETGNRKVVAYCPNPLTGEVEREDAPGWRPPGGENVGMLPGGRVVR